jgi:micrococcal nuclease
MNKTAVLAIAAMLISGLPSVAQTNLPAMTVVSVGDGDTLRARNPQKQAVTIRLACIDAPELKQQPWGAAVSSTTQAITASWSVHQS